MIKSQIVLNMFFLLNNKHVLEPKEQLVILLYNYIELASGRRQVKGFRERLVETAAAATPASVLEPSVLFFFFSFSPPTKDIRK